MGNLLIHEKSPYLLEHADNPVRWMPWGDSAFALAKEKDLPLFVSVGYSACHWCHVMARESFEDEHVAKLLNTGYVAVKVDREERADVDALLMRACQLMTGSGGWPLTVFLTPDGRPFYAGAYFPKAQLVELLSAISARWQDGRNSLLQHVDRLLNAVRASQAVRPDAMGQALIGRCLAELQDEFDAQFGGFGPAPKFPTPHVLMFLLRCHALLGDAPALAMAEVTLEKMAMGGMYDQIGGGFSRYSTDRQFLVPHFEKMLYDNALLALAYTEAYQCTKKPLFKRIAEGTLGWALREMLGSGGGFYASQDADSGGREGAYYLLDRDEILAVLGHEDGLAACRALGITREGNFEGRSIPNRLHGWVDLPASALDKLYAYRRARTALRTDDKVLTSWNALMIAALAVASGALGRPAFLDAALRALAFLDERLTDADGLLVRWRDGEAAGRGTLDDYAFLAYALTTLYDVTLDEGYMRRARALCDEILDKFADSSGCYLCEESGLSVRPKESADSALPSGNAALGMALARLARHFDDPELKRQAQAQLDYLAGAARGSPRGHAFGLMAGLIWTSPEVRVTCATSSDQDATAFVQHLNERFLPAVSASILRAEGPTSYQVCQGTTCLLPVHRLDELRL